MSLADAIKTASGPGSSDRVISSLKLPPKTKWPSGTTEGVVFRRVSFTSPIIGGLMARPAIKRCEFDSCNLGGASVTRAEFEQCKFSSSTFGGQIFAGFGKTTFRDCVFEDCKFESVVFDDSAIIGCDFTNTSFLDVRFTSSTIQGGMINGRMSRVTMNGGEINGVNFGDAEFDQWGLFDGVEVQNVTVPAGVVLIQDSSEWRKLEEGIIKKVNKGDAKAVEGDLRFLQAIGLPMFVTPSSLSSLSHNEAANLLGSLVPSSE